MGNVNLNQTKVVDQAIGEIRDIGYTIIPDFIDAARVEALSRLSDEVFKPYNARGIDGNTVTGYTSKGSVSFTSDVSDLIADPRLVAVVDAILLQDKWKQWGTTASGAGFKDAVPGEDSRELHRDGSLYPVFIPGQPLVANSLLAIDPFTPEGGSTTFVPGSHLWDKPVDVDHPTIAVEMAPGDIVIFGGNTWHGHGPNRTDRRRRCVNILYRCGWLQPIGYHAARGNSPTAFDW